MRIQSAASLIAVCLAAMVMLSAPDYSTGQPPTQPGPGVVEPVAVPSIGDPVPVPPPGAQPGAGMAGSMYRGSLGWTIHGFDGSVVSLSPDDPRLPIMQTLSELEGRLAEAADEEQEAITAEIETALGELFDRDMEHRRSELDRLTQRADDAEALNTERQAAREELIELQYQAFLQDATGLESLAPTQPYFGGFGSAFPQPTAWSSRVVVQDGVSGTVDEREIVVAGPGESPTTVVVSPVDARQTAYGRIIQARQALDAAADDAAETAAQDELKAALGEYFDRDMEIRASELESIRTSLTAMEAKIDERVEARDEIIALQLQIKVNEAAGLGFFSGGENFGAEGFSGRGPSRGGFPDPGRRSGGR